MMETVLENNLFDLFHHLFYGFRGGILEGISSIFKPAT